MLEQTEIVAVQQNSTGLLESERNSIVVVPQRETVLVTTATRGPAGPTGPQGASGTGGAVEVAFSYNDATPAALVTALTDKMVYSVVLFIEVPFDGTGASLTVGDAGDTDRLMTAAENDPTLVGAHESNPAHVYGTDTPLTLSIVAGAGATQGSGIALLYIQN
jgi:hypothetical protein